MLMRNGLLVAETGGTVSFQQSHNQSSGISPLCLIMQPRAGSTLEGAVEWLRNPEARASAHLVIGRDGAVVQMVAFNRRAWHAGRSAWGKLEGMNAYSLGIELVNAGKFRRRGDGRWVSCANRVIPDEEVSLATHKDETVESGWRRETIVSRDRKGRGKLIYLETRSHQIDAG